MRELDETLDKNPTAAAVAEMAQQRIRNHKCFAELDAFNRTGQWLHIHPFITAPDEYRRITDMLRNDPAAFLRAYKLVEDNVRRYRSFVKRPDRKAQRTADKAMLKKYEERVSLFAQALNSFQSL